MFNGSFGHGLRVVELAAILLFFSAGSALGQFSRFYEDQPVKSVQLRGAVVPAASADGLIRLTERQAVELALENNLNINIERHTRLSSTWMVEQLRGVYDPQTSLSFNWNRQKTPAATVLQGGASVTDILTNVTTHYRQLFPTGTSVEASFSGARNRTTNFFSSLVPAINTQFQVLLRQSLMEGFGRIQPDYQIEITRNNVGISEQEFKRQLTDAIFQVQDGYWELQHALQDIELREKSLQLSNTILEQNQARLEVGTAARLEVVQAEAEMALRREDLIRSKANYRRIQDQLIRLVSTYDDPRAFPGEIAPLDPVSTPPPVHESFEQLREIALANRPEVRQVDLEVTNQQVALNRSRNSLRPSLDLVAGYQQFGLGGTRIIRDFSQGFLDPPIVDIEPGGIRNSLDQLVSGEYYGYVMRLDLQLPLFNREARAENAQAQIAISRSRLRRDALRQSIGVEIRDAMTQAETSQARVEAATAAVRSADERLEGEMARFEVGVGTTRELIEAQRDLLMAQTILLRAQVDLIKSHALLDRAVGRTFERFNLRLSDTLAVNVR
jgi:outer membrane protein TolC